MKLKKSDCILLPEKFLRLAALGLFITLLSTGHAVAANFDIKPIRIFLDAQTRIEKLTLRNLSDDSLTVQIKVYRWTQGQKGEDIYEDTNDIIIFPKMLKLNKDDEKIVRVGTNLTAGPLEKTYRIYLEEIPFAVNETKDTNIRMVLKVGVPVFISPTKGDDKGDIESIAMTNGKAEIKVKNSGNSHFIVTNINITGMDSKENPIFSADLGGWYILCGKSKIYEVSIPKDKCGDIEKLDVAIKTNVNELACRGRLNVDKTMCKQGQ